MKGSPVRVRASALAEFPGVLLFEVCQSSCAFPSISVHSYADKSGYDLTVKNIHGGQSGLVVSRYRVDGTHDLSLIDSSTTRSSEVQLSADLPAPAVELVVIKRAHGGPARAHRDRRHRGRRRKSPSGSDVSCVVRRSTPAPPASSPARGEAPRSVDPAPCARAARPPSAPSRPGAGERWSASA